MSLLPIQPQKQSKRKTKAKITNEPKKEHFAPETIEIKNALTPNIPIEQVIYLNDDFTAQHIPGSNRYWFDYPESWRTITNQHLLLGVRAIRKYTYDVRKIKLELQVKVNHTKGFFNNDNFEEEEIDETANYEADYTIMTDNFIFELDLTDENLEEGIEYFAKQLNTQWDIYRYTATRKKYLTYLEKWYYETVNGISSFYLIPPDTTGMFYKCSYELKIVKMSNALDKMIDSITWAYKPVDTYYKCLPTGCSPIFQFKERAFEKADTQEYLLSASFASQTRYNYLGFTNTSFHSPKQYVIPNGETKFWIDVCSTDAQYALEINDVNELVVIEIQLSSRPYNQFI